MELVQKEIPVNELFLDPENPRFFHLVLQGRKDLTQDDLFKEIEEDPETATLIKAIRKSGVKDPLWVKESGTGKYLVLEGNRRTVILKKLLQEKANPPQGAKFDRVMANIIPSTTSEAELLLQKARLQAGKKIWGPFNEAAVTYRLRHEHLLEPEDIAAELQISITEVKDRIQNFKLYQEYAKTTKDFNPKRFSFFKDAPKPVREWFTETDENKNQYFEFISPSSGHQKIRSVSTKGGLREFAKVLDDKDAFNYLLTHEDSTLEDALEIAKDNDIMKGMPFVKRIEPLATEMRKLSETDIAKLKEEPRIKMQIKSLQKACTELLDKLGNQ